MLIIAITVRRMSLKYNLWSLESSVRLSVRPSARPAVRLSTLYIAIYTYTLFRNQRWIFCCGRTSEEKKATLSVTRLAKVAYRSSKQEALNGSLLLPTGLVRHGWNESATLLNRAVLFRD